MADQELGLKLKTDSDVPEAMGKAQKATTEFAKQAEAVNKRFKDSVKDILLSVAGPMAALSIVTQKVSDYFEKVKQAQLDANQAAIDGVNERMAQEDIYWARKTARENEDKKNKENAARQPQTTAYEFLMSDPRGISVAPMMAGASDQRIGPTDKTTRELMAERLSKDAKVQEKIRQIIAEDLAKNGMIAKPGQEGKPTSSYAAPQGVNAIVGMGNNAAMDALNAQLEENRKQTALLEQIANSGSYTPPDFTKPTSAAPSRSAYLKK